MLSCVFRAHGSQNLTNYAQIRQEVAELRRKYKLKKAGAKAKVNSGIKIVQAQPKVVVKSAYWCCVFIRVWCRGFFFCNKNGAKVVLCTRVWCHGVLLFCNKNGAKAELCIRVWCRGVPFSWCLPPRYREAWESCSRSSTRTAGPLKYATYYEVQTRSSRAVAHT